MSGVVSDKFTRKIHHHHALERPSGQERQRSLSTTRTASVLIAFIALAAVFFTKEPASWIGGGTLPLHSLEATDIILRKTPVVVRCRVARFQFST
jgi:hypothetical protein